jgi:KUP system potassium uptake protein
MFAMTGRTADLHKVVFAIEFGTGEGEGGPFALYMTLFPKHDPSEDDGRSLTTYSTIDSRSGAKASRDRLGKLSMFKWPLLVWTVFGTSLTLADGVLT